VQNDCEKNDFPTRTNETHTVSTILDGSLPVAVVSGLRYQSDFHAAYTYAPLIGPVADAAASGYPRNDLPGQLLDIKKYLQFPVKLFIVRLRVMGCRGALQQERRARTPNKFASDGPRACALYYYCGGLLGDSKNIKLKYIHRYNLRSAGQRAWKFLTPL